MRKLFVVFIMFLFAGFLLINSCQHSQNKKQVVRKSKFESSNANTPQPNSLSDQENIEGWVLLFDGQTSDGWRGYNLDSFPKNGWKIEDGTIHCLKQGNLKRSQLLDIITTQQYKDFELSIEWMVSDSASSGIFLLAQEKPNIPIWKLALKMQIADNSGNSDAKSGKNGTRLNGSLYDLMPVISPNKSSVKTWNQTRIIVYQGKVEFIQNGEMNLEFQLWTKDWEKMVSKSKYKGLTDIINAGGTDKKGYIGLQNDGNEVWFRNIKIRVVE